MKNFLLGLVAAACFPAAVMAQEKINPTDPQPTCNMCPGTVIPLSELEAYTKKALAERLTDQQVRDVEIGKAHVGIGMVYRGKFCLLYTSDAADDLLCVDLGGRRII